MHYLVVISFKFLDSILELPVQLIIQEFQLTFNNKTLNYPTLSFNFIIKK